MAANTVIWVFLIAVLVSMCVAEDKKPISSPSIPLTSNPQLADCIYTTAEPYKNGTKIPVIRCPNSTVIVENRQSY